MNLPVLILLRVDFQLFVALEWILFNEASSDSKFHDGIYECDDFVDPTRENASP
jgi:hypothetical protein